MISKIDMKRTVLLCLVLTASAASSMGNIFSFAQAQSQVMPYETGDNISQDNATGSNSSAAELDNGSNNLPCIMPPCPPGQACIQSCP